MDIKNIIIGAVATVSLVVGVVALNTREPQQEPQREPTLGALAGPDIPSPYISWGGATTYRQRAALNTATTTPCAIQAPSSTSTLAWTSLQITTPTTTQTVWTAAKANTPYATTTAQRGTITLASGAVGSMLVMASTTLVAIDNVHTLAPNQYIVWGVQGIDKIADSSKLNGYCQAEFHVL